MAGEIELESPDILDIDVSDPLRAFLAIEKAVNPRIKTINSENDIQAAILYFRTLRHAAERFGVEFNVGEPENDNDYHSAKHLLNLIKSEIENRKIDLLYEKGRRESAIQLDESWRDKIHTYVAVIRKIVEQSDAAVGLKESIFAKLHALDAEIDRGRTRVEIFTDIFVSLCEAVGAGATALTPAVRLVERLVGALTRLKPSSPTLSLPSPSDYGLDDPQLPRSNDDGPFEA